MGLVSFLRQAALSLDRVSSQDLTPLTEFYARRSQHSPGDVQVRLRSINHGQCAANRFDQGQKIGVTDLLLTLLQLLMLRKVAIKDTRLCIAELALRHYEVLLAERSQWNQADVNDVRLQLSYTADLLAQQIRPCSAREAASAVYHLNHAEHLNLKAIEGIAGESWLLAD